MRTYIDCIPCFVRQGLDSVKLITDDELIHQQVLREVLRLAGEMDYSQSPPAMAQKIHRVIRRLTRIDDPYSQRKKHFNEFALKLFSKLQKRIEDSQKPLETALRLAIAGNIIDYCYPDIISHSNDC